MRTSWCTRRASGLPVGGSLARGAPGRESRAAYSTRSRTEWRAGMGTVAPVGGGGCGGADEYKLLYAARERLASGRQYREVRAGPGFTRRVFDAIEDEDADGATPRALPAANLIAAVSALVILGVLAMVVWLIVPAGDARQQPGGDLSQTYFVNRIAETTFDAGLGADWISFGKLPVEAKSGLRPAPAAGAAQQPAPEKFVGGGVVHRRAIDANQPFA